MKKNLMNLLELNNCKPTNTNKKTPKKEFF